MSYLWQHVRARMTFLGVSLKKSKRDCMEFFFSCLSLILESDHNLYMYLLKRKCNNIINIFTLIALIQADFIFYHRYNQSLYSGRSCELCLSRVSFPVYIVLRSPFSSFLASLITLSPISLLKLEGKEESCNLLGIE